jgi:dihydrofolate reductase
MYETLVYWETADTGPDQPAVIRDWTAIWRGAEKIVYSRTLDAASSARTRIEREFDPDHIRQLKRDAPTDLSIGGAELAGQAMAAGLVDECHLILHPVLVGSGKRALPSGVHARLELLDERRFADGVVYLGYRLAA